MDNQALFALADQGGRFFIGELESIKCLVLLTAAERDSLLNDVVNAQYRMKKSIADCEVYLHPEGDHPLIWTQPDIFYMVSKEFLNKLC